MAVNDVIPPMGVSLLQVLDPQPFAGLTVSPLHGVVPVGGSTELRVDFTPDAVMKFDTRVQVAVRGAKTLELRMGGAVEAPSVDIDVVSVAFLLDFEGTMSC